MKYIFLLIFGLFLSSAHAQEGSDAGASQIGAYVGNTLPNGIDGAEEIFPLWGLRYSHALSQNGFADLSTFAGNSEGVEWQGISIGASMQIPVETLIGHAGVGIDFTRYSTVEQETTNAVGGHFVGGVLMPIGGNVYSRFDMKLNSKPGTSLYFALGLVFALGGGEPGQ